MRWSLILFTLVLSTLSAALVIPSESVDLERRARSGPSGAKLSSKKYRQNAQDHHHIYKFDHQTGAVTRDWLKKKDRRTSGKKLVAIPKTDAGTSPLWNIYIHGPLSLTLLFFPPLSDCRSCFWTSDAHATSWRSWPQTWVCILFRQHHFFAIALNSFFFLSTSDLHPDLKKDIKHILNRPGNMALVPAGVNRGVRLSLTNICIILTLLVERPVNQKGDVRQSSQKAQKESRWVCLAQLPNCQEDC